MSITSQIKSSSPETKRWNGFTLIELLVVIAIVAVLSSILLPALARSKARAQGIYCLNNTKQLMVAWVLYADEHEGKLPYNLGAAAGSGQGDSMAMNWANNVLDWEATNSDNTNHAKLVATGIGPYANGVASIYRCPSDRVVSSAQASAGWSGRVRSYSMNAMIGDAGYYSQAGYNVNNPSYVQFFKYSSIPNPAGVFVFLDEHPDSINDGYFVNNFNYPRWRDLPASYHDGAASFAYADGHAAMHRWQRQSTQPPPYPGAAKLPIPLKSNDLQDFYWMMSVMSVQRNSDYYHY